MPNYMIPKQKVIPTVILRKFKLFGNFYIIIYVQNHVKNGVFTILSEASSRRFSLKMSRILLNIDRET